MQTKNKVMVARTKSVCQACNLVNKNVPSDKAMLSNLNLILVWYPSLIFSLLRFRMLLHTDQ